MDAPRIVTVGEALYDWVSRERGASLAEATVFTRAPGGAPLNVAVGLARLGIPVGMIGCLSDDVFGTELFELLTREGVDGRWIRRVAGRQTRMAYVVTRADGDRELAAFSRMTCADADLGEGDLPETLLQTIEGFYFGSLPLAGAPTRPAVLEAAMRVRSMGGLVVFDPNVRMVLWNDPNKLLRVLRAALEVSHVVKLGADELSALTGTDDLVPGADRLMAVHPLEAVVVTYGEGGSGIRLRNGITVECPAMKVSSVDSTGAGDGFVAGLLAVMVESQAAGERLAQVLTRWQAPHWEYALARANAVGALVTTRTGAIAALPHRDELEAFISR